MYSKILADPNVDVRQSAENVLSEFLREIKYIANVQEKQYEESRRRRKRTTEPRENKPIAEEEDDGDAVESDEDDSGDEDEDWEGEGSGAWVPGQGVVVDHVAIMDIIIQHLVYAGKSTFTEYGVKLMVDELVQSTAMEWILTFLEFAQDTVVAFTPRILPAILPNLASPQ
jgi:vacuole morphology and inheritance protein 14